MVAKAQEYIDTWESSDDPVPMLCGLAVHCGICTATVSVWQGNPENEAFAKVCARVKSEQERVLLQKGLTRQHDNSITKLMLMRHGYSDRQEIDHTTKGESINDEKKLTDDDLKDRLHDLGIEC